MSDDPLGGATQLKASKGGGGKWLLGALAAVVLVGGGYAAWTTRSPSQSDDQYAINNAYDDAADPLRATPLDSEDGVASPESTDAAPAATPARRTAPSSASARAATAQEVPEATIGITPISASADYTDNENVVVTAPRRPIWTQLDCQSVEQTPGFGGAALRVASMLRHAEYLADGRSAGGTPVHLRVVFRMKDEPRRG